MSLTGAKGGSSAFKQRADTLRSNDTFEGLLVLCAGPILGPVNGLKSQKINGTPIEDASGTANFKDIVMLTADGDPAKFPQIATLKLGAGASPVSVNLPVGNTNPAGTPGPWVVKTLANTGADSIDLRFIVNQLVRQDKKGVYEATANLEIELKPTGFTTWINPNIAVPTGVYSPAGQPLIGRGGSQIRGFFQEDYYEGVGGAWTPEANSGYLGITGKTSSPYVHELRIDVPNTGVYASKSWDVRVRLREVESIDADPVYEKRIIQWESLAAVYAGDVGNHEDWRGVAWTQIYGKASDQFNGAPEIEGSYFTKIVSVPPITIFNPTTRQYTATTWDGSFSKAYTNDPAWVINDALSDSIFGLSNLAPGAHLNKWDALEISKYCSQLVTDGGSGTHPRFSMNLKVTEPQRADEFIQYLAGAVSGFAWDDGSGEWRMKLDKPEIPSDILTLESIQGEFSYAHSDIDSRYNDITMTFLNEEMDFREDRVRVFDQAHIDKYGRKPTTVVAVGCTHRQEAIRRATLRLRSSINEFRMVNYVTNRRGRLLQPFDTILIADGDLGYKLPTGLSAANPADGDLTNNRTTGRVLSMDGLRTTLTLRDSVRVEIGVTYVVHFAIPNPAYNPSPSTQPTNPSWSMPTVTISRTLINTSVQRGDITTLYLDSALPASIPEYANFALEAAGLPSIPKTFRILDIKPDEDGERVAVTAIEVDTAKYAAADAAAATPFSYSAPDIIVPPPLPPVGGSLISLVTIPGEGANRVNLVVNWQRPASFFLKGFTLRYRVNDGPLIDAVAGLQDTSWELVDPPAGTYSFEIVTHDRRGATSRPLASSVVVAGGVLTALGEVSTIATAGHNPNTLTINEKIVTLKPKEDLREIEYVDWTTRATALGSTALLSGVTSVTSKRTAWLALRNAIVPAWNNIAVNSPITRTAYDLADREYDDMLSWLKTLISEEDARRATWGNVAVTPNAPADNATNDRITDTRNDNQTAAWYRANFAFRTITEFKDGFSLGIPFSVLGNGDYGSLTTITDYNHISGGSVKQRFVSARINQGSSYERYSTSETAWSSWYKSYSGVLRPTYNDNDLLESAGVVATKANFKTAEGTAAAIAGQGPGATASAIDVLNNAVDGNVVHVQHPEGGVFASGSLSITGALKIRLPTLDNTYCMLKFVVDIFNYEDRTSSSYTISGYQYLLAQPWVNVAVQYQGPRSHSRRVTFGHDGIGACVWIGTPTSIWRYPQVKVRNFMGGLGSVSANIWKSGWSITLDASAPTNVVFFEDVPRIGDQVFGEGLYETANGAVATKPNFKTAEGVSAAVAGQGLLATRSDVDYATHVVGVTRPANNATVGAVLGSNLLDTGGATIPAPQILNNSLVLNADGTASYFNGASYVNIGAVTINGLGYTGELNADRTISSMVVPGAPADVTVNATHTGVIIASPSQFNKVLTPTLMRNGVSVRTDNRATYTVSEISAGLTGFVTVNNTSGSADKGRITITNATQTSTFKFNILWDGVLLGSYLVRLTVVAADPPLGGGGSGGAKSGSVSVAGWGTAQTVFTEVGRVSGLVKATGEQIKGSLPAADYGLSASVTSSNHILAKFQYSLAGANSWTDFGAAAVAGSTAYWNQNDFSGLEGSITVNQATTPANNTYDIRLVAAVNTSATGTLTFNAAQSFSIIVEP